MRPGLRCLLVGCACAALGPGCASGQSASEDRGRGGDMRRADRGLAPDGSGGGPDVQAPADAWPPDKTRADLAPSKLDLSKLDLLKPDLPKPDTKPKPDLKPPDSAPAGEICDNGKDDDGDKLVDCIDLASCGTKPPCASAGRTFVLHEVYPGGSDYLALRNASTVTRNLSGFSLVMYGIDVVTFVLPSKSVPPGGLAYIFEYSAGTAPGDINTGANIPFYDGIDDNAVVLKSPSGAVVDYVGFGASLVGLPAGVTQVGGPVSYATWSSTEAHFRAGMQGLPPTLQKSDWLQQAKSR